MSAVFSAKTWQPGTSPVAVVLISLNEEHNIEGVYRCLVGWAQEVFIVDSYSQDDTVTTALSYGFYVVQRHFQGFGDQWNFAMNKLPIKAPYTMKLDPDERLSEELKQNILKAIEKGDAAGFSLSRRLWFMNRPLPVEQTLVRIWRTGTCRFTNVTVNEHPIVQGRIEHVAGEMAHHDSPNLQHWFEKQNRYTTAEAILAYKNLPLVDSPRLFGTSLQRRMWLKRNFYRLPFRYFILFLYHWLWQGSWRAGWVGYTWARLRCHVMRLREYKIREMQLTGNTPKRMYYGPGKPDKRVSQYE